MEKKRHPEDEESPEWWRAAVQWIVSSGGKIHPALIFTEDSREMKLTQDVVQDELLLRIPSKQVLSMEQVKTSSTFATQLVDVVRTVAGSSKMCNTEQDVGLALFLSSISEMPTNDDFYQPYVNTFLHSSSYDFIPRRWEKDQLQKLLSGSSIIHRVQKSREGGISDYKNVQSAWVDLGHAKDNNRPFPSLESFSDMLAAVSSRAFAGLGGIADEDIAMVPLLDLADHHRGTGTKKNVSYSRASDGSVHVKAKEALSAGTTLRITYGAQGNAQLLFNYGFCVRNNIEPDGSSNDVVEFFVKPGEMVELRAGPKAYTFGPLAKALELFYPKPTQAKEKNGYGIHHQDDMNAFLNKWEEEEEGDPEDDMDAFLDECDEEEAGAFVYEDEDECEGNEWGANESSGELETGIVRQIEALNALREALMNAERGYTLQGNDLQQALALTEYSPLHFSSILISSELRTLSLYSQAIDIISNTLKRSLEGPGPATANKSDDERLVAKQAEDLAQAFLTIRYPSYL